MILGNSLARDILAGVRRSFAGLYARITVLGKGHCNPFLPEWSRPDFSCDARCIRHCFQLDRHLIPLLEGWDRPIDIIVSQHA